MSLCMRQTSIKINLNIKLYSKLVTEYVSIANRNLKTVLLHRSKYYTKIIICCFIIGQALVPA